MYQDGLSGRLKDAGAGCRAAPPPPKPIDTLRNHTKSRLLLARILRQQLLFIQRGMTVVMPKNASQKSLDDHTKTKGYQIDSPFTLVDRIFMESP